MNAKPFNFCCERLDLLCNRSNGDIFTCKDNMLFSRVKISCFRGKAHLVFHCCLYNKISSWNYNQTQIALTSFVDCGCYAEYTAPSVNNK